MYISSTYNRFVGDGKPRIHTCFIIFIYWGSSKEKHVWYSGVSFPWTKINKKEHYQIGNKTPKIQTCLIFPNFVRFWNNMLDIWCFTSWWNTKDTHMLYYIYFVRLLKRMFDILAFHFPNKYKQQKNTIKGEMEHQEYKHVLLYLFSEALEKHVWYSGILFSWPKINKKQKWNSKNSNLFNFFQISWGSGITCLTFDVSFPVIKNLKLN